MRVEQAALEDVGAVAQGTGTLARLLAALGSTPGSYTHMTHQTILLLYISVVDVS